MVAQELDNDDMENSGKMKEKKIIFFSLLWWKAGLIFVTNDAREILPQSCFFLFKWKARIFIPIYDWRCMCKRKY